MTQNGKTQNYFFYKIAKKREMEMFAFCVITFEPIKIQTCSAPQNDRLNLSHVVGGNMARNGRKSVIYEGHSFRNSL